MELSVRNMNTPGPLLMSRPGGFCGCFGLLRHIYPVEADDGGKDGVRRERGGNGRSLNG